MNKRLIKLTEQDLHRIVKESVNRILMESKGLDPSKRDSEFASNIKWSGEPDLDKANEWRKSWHNTHRGEKKAKGDTKFRDMARRENERGNFVHKLKTNPNEWFEKSVRESVNRTLEEISEGSAFSHSNDEWGKDYFVNAKALARGIYDILKAMEDEGNSNDYRSTTYLYHELERRVIELNQTYKLIKHYISGFKQPQAQP